MDDDAEGVWLVRKCRSMSVFPITTQEPHDVLRLAYTFCPHSDPIWNTMLAQCSDQPDLATITYTSDGRARKVRDATKVVATAETSKTVHSDRFTKNEVQQASGPPAPKSSRGDHAASHKEDVVRPACDVAELAKELISDRITYAHDVDRNMHFYVHNRGGQDTNRRLGMSSDYATVFARNSGRPFCRAYNWPSQKGYGHLKYGGIRNSNFLAREFARISHHFCVLWVMANSLGDFLFSRDDYPPPYPDFEEWVSTVLLSSTHTLNAIADIKALLPVLV